MNLWNAVEVVAFSVGALSMSIGIASVILDEVPVWRGLVALVVGAGMVLAVIA